MLLGNSVGRGMLLTVVGVVVSRMKSIWVIVLVLGLC